MVHEVERPGVIWFLKVVLLSKSAQANRSMYLTIHNKITRDRLAQGTVLGEPLAIDPDDNPASGQQGIVCLEVFDVFKSAVSHAALCCAAIPVRCFTLPCFYARWR